MEITKRTLESVAEFGLGRKDGGRAKNFWALGLSLWLCGQSPDSTLAWVAARFKSNEALADANSAALKAGYAYGETMELALPEVVHITRAPRRSGQARMTSGTDAMALGVAAAGALSGKSIFYCSYPITPASALLHALAKMKSGVRTFQAEDEIAAVCAAIGASYAGQLGVSASSGPGLSLKTEALGLAITAELPLIVIDVQRAGPSTGMPTKPEQSDLDMAIFGRHGEAPLAVLAPATPADCFAIMLDAAKIAIEATTPVIVLSDAFLANAVSDWPVPDPRLASRSEAARQRRRRDRSPPSAAIPRRWRANGSRRARPASPTASAASRRIPSPATSPTIPTTTSTWCGCGRRRSPASPSAASTPRCRKGPTKATSWSSAGARPTAPIRQATRNLTQAGHKVTHLHLRQLWPLPSGLEASLRRFKHVVCAEMNTGQLTSDPALHLSARRSSR